MISLAERAKIYLALESVDMRKAVNGLAILVAETFKQDPQSGHIFIFHNRNRNKIKCLIWDKNGFVLWGRATYSEKSFIHSNSRAEVYE